MKSMTSSIFTKCTEDYNAQEWNIEFDRYPNVKCLCGHSISEHLIDLDGNADYCLFVKDKDLCICYKFVDEGVKVVVPPRGKLPKNQEVQVSYVQTLSQM